jgi:hypothetical protein
VEGGWRNESWERFMDIERGAAPRASPRYKTHGRRAGEQSGLGTAFAEVAKGY